MGISNGYTLVYDNHKQALEDLNSMPFCPFSNLSTSDKYIDIDHIIGLCSPWLLPAQIYCVLSNELKIDLTDLYYYSKNKSLYIDIFTVQKILQICSLTQAELIYDNTEDKTIVLPDGSLGLLQRPFEKSVRELYIDKPIIWGKEFNVRNCLIPHYQSLRLGYVSSRLIDSMFNGKGNFIDIGAGSGLFGIKICSDIPNITGTLSDIDSTMLETARNNINTFHLSNCITLESDVLQSYNGNKLDVVISNPPFLKPGHPNRNMRRIHKHYPRLSKINELALEPASSIYYEGEPLYKRILRESLPHLKDKYLIILECDGSLEQQSLIQNEALSLLDNPNILIQNRYIFITNNISKEDMIKIIEDCSIIPLQNDNPNNTIKVKRKSTN